eukprot:15006728-Alexandrium_andersonii.AAC.1
MSQPSPGIMGGIAGASSTPSPRAVAPAEPRGRGRPTPPGERAHTRQGTVSRIWRRCQRQCQ